MQRRMLLPLLLSGAWCATSLAQTPPADADEAERRAQRSSIFQKAQQIIGSTRQFKNWDMEAELITDAIERVYERNRWDSESDRFSLDLAREVSTIPPWQPDQRFARMLDIVSDRYLLDDDQKAKLQSIFIQKSFEVFAQHADTILDYSMDVIRTRAAGEPFTPEKVARWTEMAEPVMEAALRGVNEGAREFLDELDPEQRQLVEADLDAANRRLGDVREMTQKWKRGEWDPHDWGMEDDPIQLGAAAGPDGEAQLVGGQRQAEDAHDAALREAANQQGEPDQPDLVPDVDRAPGEGSSDSPRGAAGAGDASGGHPARAGDPTPGKRPGTKAGAEPQDAWAQYVREFIARYKLNDEQQQRCWLIHKDARDRADVFEKRHERRCAAVASDAAATQKLKEQWKQDQERLFERMKTRLEALPTRAQRKAAEALTTTRPARDTTTEKP